MTETTAQTAPDTNTAAAAELLADLRQVIDRQDELNAQLKSLADQRAAIEAKLRGFHETTGLLQFAAPGLSVTFDPNARRCGYEPARWDELHKWFVENGYGYVIQRRLTDAKLLELADNGVALPAGISVSTYTKISVRRK